MPQNYKGRRIKCTTRLPYDVAMSAAKNAASRRWSMSEYIAWCVERMLSSRPPNRSPEPPDVIEAAS